MLLSTQGAVLVLLTLWLIFLSFALYRLARINRLVSGLDIRNADSVLKFLHSSQKEQGDKINALSKKVDSLEKEGKFNLQKVELVRFNPFSNTGGNQSFILAILDGNNSGVVVSSLHSRDNTRVYAKGIREGQPTESRLSKEESDVILKVSKK